MLNLLNEYKRAKFTKTRKEHIRELCSLITEYIKANYDCNNIGLACLTNNNDINIYLDGSIIGTIKVLYKHSPKFKTTQVSNFVGDFDNITNKINLKQHKTALDDNKDRASAQDQLNILLSISTDKESTLSALINLLENSYSLVIVSDELRKVIEK